ncbi:MAG: sel1 repeat family protein [Sulfurimonas sp.]|uniref:tetratricopeptide repeat protein n=1 Tax=Sulfurimonas sp. TaxID=2022749 RepID=UPI0025EBA7C0|nr:tetratricopeptide repeat protein [Sulfurimonas sp.]MCK9490697.1 sel1 repeat family protein [Sulfurimonas sp.]
MIKYIITIVVILSFNLSANSKYKKACDNREMQSCIELGILYYTGKGVEKNIKKSKRLFQIACKNRVARGCYYLGFVFLKGGQDVEQSNRKAILAFAKGCDIGSERSCEQYHKLKDKGF